VKKTNPTIQKKLLAAKGIEELLLELGYINVSEEMMKIESKNLVQINSMLKLVKETKESIEEQYLTEEQKEHKEKEKVTSNLKVRDD